MVREKVHGSGAHSREIKTPRKKKAVYMGGGNAKGRGKAADDVDEHED